MRSQAAILVALTLGTPVLADTVHLANGNKFEEVIAERRGGEVRIRLQYGEIVLPDRVVTRVEHSRSVWEEYAERESTLWAAGATATDWLELARWAERAGFERGMRRATLRAAELAPGLEGLEPLMRRIGHILDDGTGVWLSEEEYMRRRGYQRWGDEWVPRETYLARLRAQEAEETRRREEARQERITRAIEALVVAQLRQAVEPEPKPRARTEGPVVGVYPGGYFPFVFGGTVLRHVTTGKPRQTGFEDLVDRQPGSLFPVQPRRRHLTSGE